MKAVQSPRIVAFCSFALMALAVLVLLGWTLGIDGLTRISPEFVAMKVNTAICFLLSGIALRVFPKADDQAFSQLPDRSRKLAFTCAGVVFGVSLATLAEWILGLNLGIDQVLFKEAPGPLAFSPGRMSPNTAVSFGVLSASYVALGFPGRRGALARAGILFVLLMASLAIFGYMFEVQTLYGVGKVAQIALHTAVGLWIQCVGLLFLRPRQGFMAVVTGDHVGGIIFRRFFGFALLVPPVLTWIEFQLSEAGWLDRRVGMIFRISANIAIFVALIWSSSKRLAELDRRRQSAELALREANQGLEQRVEERTAELAAANKELEAFCYSVSHDLRSPLRGIDGFSQVLMNNYRDQLDEKGRGYLERVRAATQRMGQLIDDLLKLSRLTRQEMKREEVDLSAIAERIVSELRAVQPEREVEVLIEPGLRAMGDRILLTSVLENLLGNAWKFTSKVADARIELGQKVEQGAATYFVRDNGVGFDMKFSGQLFGAFQRLHRVTEFPGTGIGLASVRRVIHRHGGEIRAEAEIGKGATFYFTLGRMGGQQANIAA